MPANGYALPLSVQNQPTLIVEPGAPAKKWTLPAQPGLHNVEIPGQGLFASSEWVPPRSCVSPSLVGATMKAVGALAAGNALTSSVIPANVAILMGGGLTTMFLTKTKIAIAAVIVASLKLPKRR